MTNAVAEDEKRRLTAIRIEAITSAFPALYNARVWLCLAALAISRLTAAGISTAPSIGDEVTAVNVRFVDPDDQAAADSFRQRWEQWHPNVPLVTLDTTHRSIAKPIVKYLCDMEQKHPHRKIVVLIPRCSPAGSGITSCSTSAA